MGSLDYIVTLITAIAFKHADVLVLLLPERQTDQESRMTHTLNTWGLDYVVVSGR